MMQVSALASGVHDRFGDRQSPPIKDRSRVESWSMHLTLPIFSSHSGTAGGALPCCYERCESLPRVRWPISSTRRCWGEMRECGEGSDTNSDSCRLCLSDSRLSCHPSATPGFAVAKSPTILPHKVSGARDSSLGDGKICTIA